MPIPSHPNPERPFLRRIHWSAWCLFAVALALLVIDHWLHVLGILPYLLLLACPLMHVLMHGRHHHKNRGDTGPQP